MGHAAFAEALALSQFNTKNWIFHTFEDSGFLKLASGGALGAFVTPHPELDDTKVFVYTGPTDEGSAPRSLQNWRKEVYPKHKLGEKPEFKNETASGDSYSGQMSVRDEEGLNEYHVLAFKTDDAYYLFVESHVGQVKPDPYASVDDFYASIQSHKPSR